MIDDALTDEQLLEHQAAAWIDGWYHGQSQTAEIVAAIRNQNNIIIAAGSTNGSEVLDNAKFHTAHSVIEQWTSTKQKREKSKTAMTPNQFHEHLKAKHG